MSQFLSVIIPAYNGERYLDSALRSLIQQDDGSLEVIVVDDGSTDDTLTIAEQYSSALKLQIHRLAHTGNWINSTNYGLERAAGEFVCFLHQDDYWLPHRLETIRALSQRYPDADVLLHPSLFVDESGRRCGVWRCPFPQREGLITREEVLRHLVIQNFVSIPAPAVRRKNALAAHPLDNSLWFTADWKFWLSLSGSWAYSPEPQTAFRLHSASQTVARSHDSAAFRAQLVKAVEALMDSVPVEIQRAARFNLELNVFLAARHHRQRPSIFALIRSAASAGPSNVVRALHSARVMERSVSRLRAGLNG